MDEQIKQIAERVRGLRDALGLGIDEMAESCGLASAQYQKFHIFVFEKYGSLKYCSRKMKKSA